MRPKFETRSQKKAAKKTLLEEIDKFLDKMIDDGDCDDFYTPGELVSFAAQEFKEAEDRLDEKQVYGEDQCD